MRRSRQIPAHTLAVALCLSLVMIYAIVPAKPDLFGVPPWPQDMLKEHIMGAFILCFIVMIVGFGTRYFTAVRQPMPVHPVFVTLVFVGGCFWLNEYSWIEFREGLPSTISALFRILWFVIIISIRHERLSVAARMTYVLATLILMAFDQSRTYFLIALLILLANFSRVAILGAITAALMVAAIRSNENQGFVHSITFAVGGEGYLGSRGVFQVLSLPEGGVNFFVPATQALFAPVTALITAIAKRLGYPSDLYDSSSYLGSFIKALTNESYPPMGGFFILSEFIRAGWFGFLCMALYMTMTFIITKRLFDTAEIPIGSFIVILAIKSSPMTYWNLVLMVWITMFIFNRANNMLPFVKKNDIPSPQFGALGVRR